MIKLRLIRLVIILEIFRDDQDNIPSISIDSII